MTNALTAAVGTPQAMTPLGFTDNFYMSPTGKGFNGQDRRDRSQDIHFLDFCCYILMGLMEKKDQNLELFQTGMFNVCRVFAQAHQKAQGPSKSMCFSGQMAELVDSLTGILPECEIIFINQEVITEMLTKYFFQAVCQHFETLQHDQLETQLSQFCSDGIPSLPKEALDQIHRTAVENFDAEVQHLSTDTSNPMAQTIYSEFFKDDSNRKAIETQKEYWESLSIVPFDQVSLLFDISGIERHLQQPKDSKATPTEEARAETVLKGAAAARAAAVQEVARREAEERAAREVARREAAERTRREAAAREVAARTRREAAAREAAERTPREAAARVQSKTAIRTAFKTTIRTLILGAGIGLFVSAMLTPSGTIALTAAGLLSFAVGKGALGLIIGTAVGVVVGVSICLLRGPVASSSNKITPSLELGPPADKARWSEAASLPFCPPGQAQASQSMNPYDDLDVAPQHP